MWILLLPLDVLLVVAFFYALPYLLLAVLVGLAILAVSWLLFIVIRAAIRDA